MPIDQGCSCQTQRLGYLGTGISGEHDGEAAQTMVGQCNLDGTGSPCTLLRRSPAGTARLPGTRQSDSDSVPSDLDRKLFCLKLPGGAAAAQQITARAKPLCTVTNTLLDSPIIRFRSRAMRLARSERHYLMRNCYMQISESLCSVR